MNAPTNYCHVSRQIADHLEKEAQKDAREDYIDACLIELADTGSIEVAHVTIDIGDVIDKIVDDPSHEQAHMEVMQGNTKFLQSIMERVARELIERELDNE